MIFRFSSSIFLPFFILELVAIYFYVDSYGFLSYLAEVLLSAILGLFLVLNVGFGNLRNSLNFLRFSDILSSFGIGVAGFLLFLPGILTDFFGVIIALVSLFFRNKKPKFDEFNGFENRWQNSQRRYDSKDEIIDVEVVDDSRHVR